MATEFVSLSDMSRLKDILNDLLDLSAGLRDNEIEFLDTLDKWEGCFTVSQATWLEQIGERLL
jgi:hypothetical protein